MTSRAGWQRSVVAVLPLISVAIAVLALPACGGSTTTAAGSATPSATLAPSAAASALRLQGTDSPAVTRQTIQAYVAASDARSAKRLAALCANDFVFHCYATGVHVEGPAAYVALMKQVWGVTAGVRGLASHAGRGWEVLELCQDFGPAGSIQLLQLLETRRGKIVRHENYYQPRENQVRPLQVAKPLRSVPGPEDTPAAAEATALKYAAALQAKDPDAILALAAADNDFRDTAADASSSTAEWQRYAAIFKAPTDLAFRDIRYVFGPGWAAVRWTASSAGSGAGGASMLEIRDGKVCRETLYYNSANVPFTTAVSD